MLYGSHIKNWHLANHMKKQNKKLWNAKSIGEKLKTKGLICCLFHFFHVICKISNFNLRTAKHLAHTSCTELTLTIFMTNSNFYATKSRMPVNEWAREKKAGQA